MDKTYDFGDALYFLRQERQLTRKAWHGTEHYLELDDDGKIVIGTDEQSKQWTPTQEDILAEDWYDV